MIRFLTIITLTLLAIKLVLLPASRRLGLWLMDRPISYATWDDYENDDPVSSPKWRWFRLGVRILEYDGNAVARIEILDGSTA